MKVYIVDMGGRVYAAFDNLTAAERYAAYLGSRAVVTCCAVLHEWNS